MEQLLFASLPAPPSRWKSFLTGWGMQATFVATLLAFNALFPQAIPRAKKYVVTNLVAYEPPLVTEAQPVNPRLTIKIKPVKLPVIETPTVAKIVLPAPVWKRVEPEPDVKPPEIKLDSSKLPLLPIAPTAKVAAANTFATPTKEVPTSTKPAAKSRLAASATPTGSPHTKLRVLSTSPQKAHLGCPQAWASATDSAEPKARPAWALSATALFSRQDSTITLLARCGRSE